MPALYGATFIISVEIIFLLLYWDIFTEFPLPALSECSWHVGTRTSLGEEREKHHACQPAFPSVHAPSDKIPNFSVTFLQSPVFQRTLFPWTAEETVRANSGSNCRVRMSILTDSNICRFLQGSISKHRMGGWILPFQGLTYLESCGISFLVWDPSLRIFPLEEWTPWTCLLIRRAQCLLSCPLCPLASLLHGFTPITRELTSALLGRDMEMVAGLSFLLIWCHVFSEGLRGWDL